MIVCTEKDNDFEIYKEQVKNKKVLFHIKDIFKDHWDNYKIKFANRKRRPIIDKVINNFIIIPMVFKNILYMNVLIVIKKKLFHILVKLVFVLPMVINIMKIERFLFTLNFLILNIAMLFLLSLKN